MTKWKNCAKKDRKFEEEGYFRASWYMVAVGSTREGELLAQVLHLQQSVNDLVEELQRQKLKNSMLERQLNVVADRKDKRTGD